MAEPQLTLVFIPPLVTLLDALERQKGSPLSEQEVIEARNRGVCMAMRIEEAQALVQKRGFTDIDPENAWAEWQRVRDKVAKRSAIPQKRPWWKLWS